MDDEVKPNDLVFNASSMALDTLKFCQFTFYIFGGVLACVSSSVVIFTICCHKHLRTKEYNFLAGLAVSDMVRGVGYLQCGVMRLIFLFQKTETLKVTPKQCMLQIYSTLMMYGQQASATMVMILAMDRFFAVCFFNQYRNWGSRYSLLMITFTNIVCAATTSAGWIMAFCFMPSVLIPQVCRIDAATSYSYYVTQMGSRFFPGPLSALFYLSTFAVIFRMRGGNATNAVGLRRQIRMTKSVAVIMLNTFLFSSVPFGWAFLSLTTNGSTTAMFDAASPFFYTLSLLSAATNILVYCAKYEKFRNVMLRQFSWCTVGCRRGDKSSMTTTIASEKPIFNRSTLTNAIGSLSNNKAEKSIL